MGDTWEELLARASKKRKRPPKVSGPQNPLSQKGNDLKQKADSLLRAVDDVLKDNAEKIAAFTQENGE